MTAMGCCWPVWRMLLPRIHLPFCKITLDCSSRRCCSVLGIQAQRFARDYRDSTVTMSQWRDWDHGSAWWSTSSYEATWGDSEPEPPQRDELAWSPVYYFGANPAVLHTTLADVNNLAVAHGLSGPQLWVSLFVRCIALEK